MVAFRKIKEVALVDQYAAIMGMLEALGYDTDDIKMVELAVLKHDVINAIHTANEYINEHSLEVDDLA